MSSPRTETTVRPSSEQPKKTSLSAAQVAASALAAVSSAVVASFFGVAGTLIGAALASVITTVCASLYATSLKKTNERLRKVLTAGQPRPDRRARAGTRALPARLDPRRGPATTFRPRWGRVAVYAVSVFVVAMAIVTGIELIGQQPVSALVGNSSSSGTTTLGELANTSSSSGTTPTTPPSPPSTAPATPTTESSTAEPTATDESDSSSATPSRTSSSSSSSSSSA